MVSARSLVPLGAYVLVAGFSGVAGAQDPFAAPRPDVAPLWRAAANFVLTLVIGGVLLAWGYDYVTRIGERIRGNPVASFLWGLGVLVAFVASSVVLLLLLGVLGRLLFIALLLGFVVVVVVGNVLAYLTVLESVVENRWAALGLAAIVTSVVSFIPVVGPVAGFLITCLGVGAIVRNYRA